ncbi:carbohydrate esterase family 4 protein [Stereum hirsutum FP-91666 SS1]|uniref:carbohydrate esterase family 4 protein n=1 Tax=Stereum hirsutum (strain FP-91666) TaxID=721885 RepID=UPI000440A866|nr:carbohydrate esterase family 4 protein [Stereum hirsutum FP-91666 SS1]EIM88713.1 carbohydrate esterase family 4 protein [Stereum hirsutum FP-91666 SS1]
MSTTADNLAAEYGPRDLKGYGQHTPDPKWPNGAKIAISIVLNYEEGSEVTGGEDGVTEMSGSEKGPGMVPMRGARDVNTESLYEYGSRAGVWRVLRLFKEYNVHCTSYAVGQALERHPEVAIALEQDGHELASHGYRWVDRTSWTIEEEAEYARKAINAISSTSPSGTPPRGWYYGKAFTKNDARSRSLIARVFKEENIPLLYYSDYYGDDLPYWIPYPGGEKDQGLLIVPYALDTNDFRNTRHDAFISPNDFSDYLIAAFDELYREGVAGQAKMLSIGLHGRIIGRPGRIAGLRKFLEYVKEKGGVWFATREEIAKHWIETFPYEAKT